VKVVTDAQGYALYFSRAPIPLVRDDPDRRVVNGLHYMHLGVYMYTKETLLRFAALPTSPLEDAEKLEQLRGLEQGLRIRVWETLHASLRVDTPEDVAPVAKQLEDREALTRDVNPGRAVPSR
jgi:3-deoxy-manno-octulosonate cytidylyltransferase (CMP-KDO synthetase)